MTMLRTIKAEDVQQRAFGETVFDVKLCPHGRFKALRIKHSRAGRVDQEALNGELLATHVVGWKDLSDADGKEIPFRSEIVAEVLLALPETVVMDLLLAVLQPATKVAEALGNS